MASGVTTKEQIRPLHRLADKATSGRQLAADDGHPKVACRVATEALWQESRSVGEQKGDCRVTSDSTHRVRGPYL